MAERESLAGCLKLTPCASFHRAEDRCTRRTTRASARPVRTRKKAAFARKEPNKNVANTSVSWRPLQMQFTATARGSKATKVWGSKATRASKATTVRGSNASKSCFKRAICFWGPVGRGGQLSKTLQRRGRTLRPPEAQCWPRGGRYCATTTHLLDSSFSFFQTPNLGTGWARVSGRTPAPGGNSPSREDARRGACALDCRR